MALVGYEALIALGVLLVVFLWGPQKLPELAKSIGLARKEFEKAKSDIGSISNPISATTPAPSTEDSLISAAKSMGVPTEGRTKEQIAKDIADKTLARPT